MCTSASTITSYEDLGRSSQELHIQRVTISKFIVVIDSLRFRYIEQQLNDTLSSRNAKLQGQEWVQYP
jgi:hypothetical protein